MPHQHAKGALAQVHHLSRFSPPKVVVILTKKLRTKMTVWMVTVDPNKIVLDANMMRKCHADHPVHACVLRACKSRCMHPSLAWLV